MRLNSSHSLRRQVKQLAGSVLVVSLALAGCAESDGTAEPAQAKRFGGIWQTEGYGLVLDARGDKAQVHEVTAVSCLPSFGLEILDSEDGDLRAVLALPEEDVRIDLQPGADDSELWMRIDSVASRRRMFEIDALPDLCMAEAATDPESVVEVFWHTFSEHYPFFAAKGIDWDSVGEQARGRVTAETDDEALFEVILSMVEPLQDAHTFLSADAIERGFGGSRDSEFPLGPPARERLLQIIMEDYLESPLTMRCNDQIGISDLAPDVRYMIIGSFSDYGSTYQDGFTCLQETLDIALEGASDLSAMVLDVRVNFGGADPYGLAIASRLTANRYLAYTKETRNDIADPASWSEGQDSWVEPHPGPRFEGPVYLLTSPLSISAAETFTMAVMGRSPEVRRIGENTQGVFSDVLSRSLPNGWSFGLPNERFLTEEARSFDGPGIAPHEEVPVFRPADLEAGKDPALDRALELIASAE